MVGKIRLLGMGVAVLIATVSASTAAFAAGKVFMEEQTARWGSTYKTISANHPNTCQNECTSDKQCLSWTFVQPTKDTGGECQLKNMVPHRADNACCVSGVLVGHGAPQGDVERGWWSAQPVSSKAQAVSQPSGVVPAAAINPAPVMDVTPVDLEVPVEESADDEVEEVVEEEEVAPEPAPEPPVQLVPASYRP